MTTIPATSTTRTRTLRMPSGWTRAGPRLPLPHSAVCDQIEQGRSAGGGPSQHSQGGRNPLATVCAFGACHEGGGHGDHRRKFPGAFPVGATGPRVGRKEAASAGQQGCDDTSRQEGGRWPFVLCQGQVGDEDPVVGERDDWLQQAVQNLRAAEQRGGTEDG